MSLALVSHTHVPAAPLPSEGDRSSQAVVSLAADAQWLDVIPGERLSIRVPSSVLGGGVFCILETTVAPNVGPPMHYHDGADEVFYVLSGSVRFVCSGKLIDAPVGTVIVVPKGAPHCFLNATDAPVRMLTFFTPGDIESLFPKLAHTPPEQWPELARQYDTVIVGPPLNC